MQISRRSALLGAGAAAAVARVPTSAVASDGDPVVALDRERKRHLNIFFAAPSNARAEAHFHEAVRLQAQMAETPATSIEGVARKLSLYCDRMTAGYKKEKLLRSAMADACGLAGEARS